MMMKYRNQLRGAVMAAAIALSAPALAADVVIGLPNWPSAQATAHVLKKVMEDNLGLEVEMQNGTNPVIFEAMASGAMHVHPEVWLPNQQNLHDKYVGESKPVKMNPNGVDAEQGICVTKGTAERTGIKELSELSNPDMAKNFDTDGDGKGEMWIGVPGWASTNAEKVRAKSYGYSETMHLKELDEALALAEVDKAVTQKQNIVFFCYTPHHMFALHELVKLEEPPHDPAKWTVLQPTDDPDWLNKSEAGVGWNVAKLHIHYAANLEDTQPAAAALLANAKFTTEQFSAMTYAVVVDKKDPAEFAAQWVKDNSDLVEAWLK